jgi:hypothetical protein
VEQSHSESAGKGGGGGSVTTYSYFANAAILICEGEAIVRKIWADGRLIYNIDSGNTGYTGSDLPFRFYTGSETQEPDSLIESIEGVGSTPAYRGRCYMVMEMFALAEYGNRIPNFTFEVVSEGTAAYPAVVDLGNGTRGTFDSIGRLWIVSGDTTVNVWDTETQTMLVSNTVDAEASVGGNMTTAAHTPFYVEERDEIWVSNSGSGSSGTGVLIWRFSPTTLTQIGTIRYNASVSSGTSMAYSKSMRKVILFNKYTGVNTSKFVDVDTLAVTVGESSHAVTESVQVDAHNLIVSYGPNWFGLMITDLSSGIMVANVTGPLSINQEVFYDPDLDALLWVRGAADVYMVSLPDLTVTTHYSLAGNLNSIAKSAGYYYVGQFSTPTSRLYIFDSDFSLVDTIVTGGVGEPGYGYRMFVINDKLWAIGGNIGLGILPHVKLVTTTDLTLASVVEFLSGLAGLEVSDLDTSTMTEVVIGWFCTRQASARTLLEPLLAAYRYDAVESEGVIKFVKRGGASVATLTQDDLILENDRIVADNTRAQEVDLPKRVNIMYSNPDADYQQSTQFSQRMVGSSIQVIGIELPLVMTDDEARKIADVTMYDAYASRTLFERNVPRRWSLLEPTDVITYISDDVSYRARISNKTEGGSASQLRLIADDISVNTFSGPGAPAPAPDDGLFVRTITLLEFMDTALFRDADDDVGFYVAACGANDGWTGCVLHRSADDGATWLPIMSITAPATMGGITVALPAGRTDIFDETNTITVLLSHGTLSSATELQVLNGANACVVGDEILQFKTAVLNGDGTYTLYGLLRARRGTEWAIDHASGERFVLLTEATIRRVAMDTAEIGVERLYKAVTIGMTLEETPFHRFTFDNIGQECLSPVQVASGKNAAGDVLLKWVRRTRVGGAWRDYADASLGEVSEGYELEMWTSDGVTLKRTVTGLSTPSYTYAVANWSADFPADSEFLLKVYQMSDTMGRGIVASVAITLFVVTEFYTDFHEYTTGVAPDDWTASWNTADVTYTVLESGGSKYLKIDKTASTRSLLSWDQLGTFADGEITARIKGVGRSASTASLVMNSTVLRGGGGTGSENAYRSLMDRDLVGSGIGKITAGSASTLDSSTTPTWSLTEWWWTKHQTIGTTVRMKVWLDGTEEPSAWTHEAVDATHASGLCGMMVFDSGNDMEVAEVRVRIFS